MKPLREALERLKKRLERREDDLTKARRRYKRFHKLAVREHRRHKTAERLGVTPISERLARRAASRRDKAVYWRGEIKEQVEKIHHLEPRIEEKEAQIAKWIKEHGAHPVGRNKIRGGTPEERLRLAIHTAILNYRKGEQPGYYSQEGMARKYSHGLYDYPYGHIWDCSTFADAMYFVCGLPSPSGPGAYRTGGYTGTEIAHGRRIPESEARTGDLVIYLEYWGDTRGHHVEVVDDPDRKTTVGHGNSAINAGTFDLFGDGLYEVRTYH